MPEINDGLIAIRKIARIAGERAKIAVESYDDRITPVGVVVGVKGSRVHGIVRELRNENLDVINYTANAKLFIQRALAPATINRIELDTEEKKANVWLNPKEVSLAIGKGGLNIKLACMITDYDIEVFRDTEGEQETNTASDVYLDEFTDEIDVWVVEALKHAGYQTARQVLAVPREVLAEEADLEFDTVDEVIRVLNTEFEHDDENT